MIAFVEGGLQAGRICTTFVPVKSSRVVVASFLFCGVRLLDLAARLTTLSLDVCRSIFGTHVVHLPIMLA